MGEGPDLEDRGTLLRELWARLRNGEPTGGGAGGKGAWVRPRVDIQTGTGWKNLCDPGGVTGVRQLRGGQRLGHRAGVHRARWVAAQDHPAGDFGGDTRGKSDGEN